MRNHFQRIIRRRTLRRKPQVKTLKGSNYETNELRCRFNHIFIYTIFYNRNGRQKEIKIKRKEFMKDTKMSAEKVVKEPKPKLMNIKLEKLRPFEDHPYKVLDDVSMTELVKSIKEYGLLNRIIVRPLEDKPDEYEIISGHRRVRAAELLEMKGVPAVIHFIDPVAAEVVKSVFKMCLEGKGNETIPLLTTYSTSSLESHFATARIFLPDKKWPCPISLFSSTTNAPSACVRGSRYQLKSLPYLSYRSQNISSNVIVMTIPFRCATRHQRGMKPA